MRLLYSKPNRTIEFTEILNVNINLNKKYYFKNVIDLIYIFVWLEELIPNYQIDLSLVLNICDADILILKKFIDVLNTMRSKLALEILKKDKSKY